MIDLSTCKTASEAAARWWANRARNPGFWSNGDNSDRGAMISIMMTVGGNSLPRPEDKIAKFESILKSKIDHILTAPAGDNAPFRYGALAKVDHPDCPRNCTDEEYAVWEASYRPVSKAAHEDLNARGVLYAACLGVDYSPDWELREALVEAGLPELIKVGGLPAKTNMKVQFDSVRVGDGYQQPWKYVWGPTGFTYNLKGEVISE